MFTKTKAQLHVSALNVGHLQVLHEEPINKLHQRVWGVYSLWGGVGFDDMHVYYLACSCYLTTQRR